MVQLDQSDPKFEEIKQQFLGKWTTGSKPTVESILRIDMNSTCRQNYETYRGELVARGVTMFRSAGPGNEQRRFHGTGQTCKLGRPGKKSQPCNDTNCCVCQIIKGGFKTSKALGADKLTGKPLMFGKGIYFTSTSSKAHNFNKGSEQGLGSNRRSTFMCLVLVGRGKEMKGYGSKLTEAPAGFDSVLAEPSAGALNHDEVVVYKDCACLPRYLIVYTS